MENIPCKWLEHWRENQSPLGSGEYWPMDMTDCNHPPFNDESKEIELENYGKCDKGCPGYEPMEVEVCEKHGEFIKEWGCESCMADELRESNPWLEQAAEHEANAREGLYSPPPSGYPDGPYD